MVVAEDRLGTLLDAFVSVAEGLHLEDTLRRVISAAVTLVDARYGALGVIGEHGELSNFIHVGMDTQLATEIGPLPTGRGLLGQLITDPRPLRMDDLHSHPQSMGFPAGHPEMTSFLGVPIRVRGGVFGNLYLTDKRHGRFTEEDVQLTVALAAAAGVAIANSHLFDRNRRRQRWQRAVSAVQALVLSGASEAEVFAEVARRLRILTSAAYGVVAQPDASGGAGGKQQVVSYVTADLEAAGALSATSPQQGAPVAAGSALDQAYRSGETVTGVVSLVSAEPSVAPTLVLPLRSGEQVVGAFGLARTEDAGPFAAEEVELCEVLVAQASLALSYVTERRERERLAVFEERDRIARDLHDLVIQRIFAAGMMLEGVRRTGDLPAPAADRLERAVDELDATVKEIRTTIFELHSARAGDLRARLLQEIDRAAEVDQRRPSLTFSGPLDAVVADWLADHVVAVVREGLSNARRHAPGAACEVMVGVDSQRLVVEVKDEGAGQGVGVDSSVLGVGGSLGGGDGEVRQAQQSGLANLAERAAAVGGECELSILSDGSTLLRWWAPLP